MDPIAQEVAGVDFGDRRLARRCATLLTRLGDNPQASIPAACRGWSETDAAYKFFAHPQVTAERILQPHARATIARCSHEPTILLVQDTTELDYTHKRLAIAGLGILDHRGRQGMHLHVQAALTPEGCCLGVLGAEFFTRDQATLGQTRQRASLSIEEKESARWLQGYRQACQLQQESLRQVVSIADREADIYEIFVEGQRTTPRDQARKADWIIRGRLDRSLPQRTAVNCYAKLWATVEAGPEQFRYSLDLPSTGKRQAREAQLAVRAEEVTLKPPQRRGRKLPHVRVRVVLVQEIDPPADADPVEWLLLTSLPIDRREQLERAIAFYHGRWPIETFFRTLKTGCGVEELQLESIDRLQPCIALYLIVAWRVLFVMKLGRECPQAPAEALFAEAEWRSVWQIVKQQPPPANSPSLGEFVKLLAQLGGHQTRNHDPPPGPKALWIGIRRMSDFARAWLTFGPGRDSKPP